MAFSSVVSVNHPLDLIPLDLEVGTGDITKQEIFLISNNLPLLLSYIIPLLSSLFKLFV